jgi:hypothetical protein
MDASEIFLQDEEERLSIEREDYQEGLQDSIMKFERQYNLRNQRVPENLPKGNPSKGNPPKGNSTKEALSNIPSSSQPKRDSTEKGIVDKGKQK